MALRATKARRVTVVLENIIFATLSGLGLRFTTKVGGRGKKFPGQSLKIQNETGFCKRICMREKEKREGTVPYKHMGERWWKC